MIEFLRMTKSLQGVKLDQLPQPWICDNQDKTISLIEFLNQILFCFSLNKKKQQCLSIHYI
jgi:hypothetical protein